MLQETLSSSRSTESSLNLLSLSQGVFALVKVFFLSSLLLLPTHNQTQETVIKPTINSTGFHLGFLLCTEREFLICTDSFYCKWRKRKITIPQFLFGGKFSSSKFTRRKFSTPPLLWTMITHTFQVSCILAFKQNLPTSNK